MEFDLENPAFYLALEELAEALGAVDSADPQEADRQVKKLLQEAFPGQDFGEGSLFSLTQSGKTALEAFLEELAPMLSAGAEKCAEKLVRKAKSCAEERRRGI